MKTFGVLLKKLRLQRDWTLDDLAAKVGCRKGYLSGIESGALNPPSIKIVRRIAKIFRMDVRSLAWLAWREKAPKPIRDIVIRAPLPEAQERPALPLAQVPLLDKPGRALALPFPPKAGRVDGAVTLDADIGGCSKGDVLLLRQEVDIVPGALAYVVCTVGGKPQSLVRIVSVENGSLRLHPGDVIARGDIHEYHRAVGRITLGL